MNSDCVFQYIRYACYFYQPSKPNKKKISELIKAIPFFMNEEDQNILFEIIVNNPIHCYYDKAELMNEYGYLLYKKFNTAKKAHIKDYEEYKNEIYPKDDMYKQRRTHTLFFVCIVLLIFFYIYKIK
jgi:hypothetical protein